MRRDGAMKIKTIISLLYSLTLTYPLYGKDNSELSQAIIETIVQEYRIECNRALTTDMEERLILPDDLTYQIVVDSQGKTATVLYTEFKCGDLGYPWCGTGGCDAYLVVDGKTFVRYVTFPPRELSIPTNLSDQIGILFPLHGTYCETASGGPGSGPQPCYEIAIWDDRRKTFMTRFGTLELVSLDEIRPYPIR